LSALAVMTGSKNSVRTVSRKAAWIKTT